MGYDNEGLKMTERDLAWLFVGQNTGAFIAIAYTHWVGPGTAGLLVFPVWTAIYMWLHRRDMFAR